MVNLTGKEREKRKDKREKKRVFGGKEDQKLFFFSLFQRKNELEN